jgi:DNA-binding MarR family transcriptional regulator
MPHLSTPKKELSSLGLGKPYLRGRSQASEVNFDKTALTIFQERSKLREQISLFGLAEDAWDVLFVLYANADSESRFTIDNLVMAVGYTRATGYRRVEELRVAALIQRRTHPNDRRTSFIELSQEGKVLVESYLISSALTAKSVL